MSSIEKDSRFSRVLTDPRFLPMPTYQKKVKIDKRFNALFTSKDFGHRTLLDKRGRPIHDVSKRGKHIMEQFYQVSSDESSSEDEEAEDDSDSDEKEQSPVAKDKTAKQESVDVVEPKEKKRDGSIKSKTKPTPTTKLEKEQTSTSDGESSERTTATKKRKIDLDCEKDKESCDEESLAQKMKKGQKQQMKQKSTESIQEDSSLRKKSKKKLKAIEDEDDNVEKSSDKKTKEMPSVKPESDNDYESSGSEEESSESDESSDGEDLPEYTPDFDLEDTMVEHKWNELHTDAPAVSESTHRLAVCNMDWDFVKAQDLFVLFKSFTGEGGSVRSVIIYPSEFGKERMAEEAVLGPKEMRENLKNNPDKGGPEKKKNRKGKQRLMDQQKLKRYEKQKVKAEREVLRDYQLNRMRYYYAVVDCDSVETADNIYKECDGQEYQLSSVKLDLRYIPDDMTFDDTPKESFTEDQGLVDYTPQTFNSTALSQAKVEVTWDETEFDRLHKKMVHMQHKELENIVEENKYADIIAPPESDSDLEDDGRPQWLKSVLAGEDEEDISEDKKISIYRKVLMDKLVEEEEKEEKENEVDKELEWTPGLKSAVENQLKKNEKVQGTLVDDYLAKKKEKKKKKREQKKAELAKTEDGDSNEDENMIDDDEIPGIIDNQLKEIMESEGVSLDTLKVKKKQLKKKKKPVEEDKDDSEAERERAELELLMMGDGEEKSLAKPEKVQEGKLSRRQKKKKALLAKEQKKKEKEDLAIDVDDPRFGAMFTSHHFHIDPSAPEFKKTQNMMKLVDEQIKRKPKTKKGEGHLKSDGNVGDEEADSRAVSKKLVESLKRKMKK